MKKVFQALRRNKLWVLLFLFLIIVILWKPALTNTKALLLITQEFPQIPFKPLHSVTREPILSHVQFGEEEKVVADIMIPGDRKTHPAIIFAMAVRIHENDRHIILGLADSLARLGYVILWPRSENIEDKIVKFEDPKIFIEGFNYLKTRPEVKKERISFVGFSAGSSFAMIAAEEPSIASEVHSVVFFGGYYNLFDYITSIATSQITVGGEKVAWQPSESALWHSKGILETYGLSLDTFKNEGDVPDEVKDSLAQYSPDTQVENFKARLFILHDKGDTAVPWVESEKLKKAVEGKTSYTYHISNLFEHIQPKKEVNVSILKEFLGLYLFLYRAFYYI